MQLKWNSVYVPSFKIRRLFYILTLAIFLGTIYRYIDLYSILGISRNVLAVDRIYVLSASQERKRYVQGVMKAAKLSYHLFQGLSVKDPALSRLTDTVIALRDAQPANAAAMQWAINSTTARIAGRIGCSIGHYAIWHQVVEHNLASVLILEDDIDIDLNLSDIMAGVLKGMSEDWNMIYLGYCSPAWHTNATLNPGSEYHTTFRRLRAASCTHAYIINQKTAKMLLNMPEIYEPNYNTPCDLVLSKFMAKGLLGPVYGMTPPLVIQRPKTGSRQSLVSPWGPSKPETGVVKSDTKWNEPDPGVLSRYKDFFPREKSAAYQAGMSYWHDLIRDV